MPPQESTRGGGATADRGTITTTQQPDDQQEKQDQPIIECDYLVVGAGCSGMSFVDTVLAEDPKATIVIVDRNSRPGGHWVHVYPFCSLHQTSCNYGVNSEVLGKNLNRKGHERYDIHDRSTGLEVQEYYQRVREKFEATGRVRFFFNCEYQGFRDGDEAKGVHRIATTTTTTVTTTKDTGDDDDGNDNNNNNNSVLHEVHCRRKLVTVENNVQVPSMRGPPIPVVEDAMPSFVPPNDLPLKIASGDYENYVVFGCGKTGADAVVYLLRRGIDPSRITWIVSRDVWYFIRDALADFYHSSSDLIMGPAIKADSAEDCFLRWEAKGLVDRLDNHPDKYHIPRVFKGPTMDREEMALMKTIQNVVRMGRATSVHEDHIILQEGVLPYSQGDTLLVDCMVDGCYGYDFPEDFSIFEPGRIKMGPLTFLFNVSMTAAQIAFLECTLRDDDDKNARCYFRRGVGPKDNTNLEEFLGGFYLQGKSIEALTQVEGGMKFLLNSRCSIAAPQHHRGGMLRLLWKTMKPMNGMSGLGKKFAQKVEAKGYADLDHCFGVETLGAKEVAF